MWTIFKAFFEFVTTLLPFYVSGFLDARHVGSYIDFLQADVLVDFLLMPAFILFTLPQLLISVSL